MFGVFLAATVAAGSTGLLFPPGPWYERLLRPTWTPPNRAFPLVWTALYLLMACVATRVAGLPGSGFLLALWALQIALNTLWTPVFFGAHRIGLGMVVMVALWAAVAVFIWQAWPLDWLASLLMLPYLAWLTVAAALNLWIWRRNPAGGQ